MSSPLPDDPLDTMQVDNEHEDNDAEGESEGEGEPTMLSDDSSEEDEDDPEEARKIREGFIVDEDEDEEGGEVRERPKKHKHRRRHRHREEEDDDEDRDEELDEDDLRLVEENTGQRIEPERFSRIRRHRSPSPAAEAESRAPKRQRTFVGSDDDLPEPADLLTHIFDDETAAAEDMDDDEDMDDFIEEDEEDDEEDRTLNEEEREQRRRERKRDLRARRAAAIHARPELAGLDASAWEEIVSIFGDGLDYEDALAADNVAEEEEKPDMEYKDVFEPSEIKARMLTHEDDVIRNTDVPERMQLSTSALSSAASLLPPLPFDGSDLNGAAHWVAMRLSERVRDDFFFPSGRHHDLIEPLVMAVRTALEYLLINKWEVPYIWHHKRDYISHFDPNGTRVRTDLLTLDELWKIQSLGARYRSLVERKKSLRSTFDSLGVEDEYFDQYIWEGLENTEMVADAMEWVGMKYRRRLREVAEMNEVNGETAQVVGEDGETVHVQRMKRPTRTSAYDLARNSMVSSLADSFGLSAHDVVLNYLHKSERSLTFESELRPSAFAEQYAPDGLDPDETLERARFVLGTEMGKDPLLRHAIREKFQNEAVVTVRPTERGIATIDEYHPLFRIKYITKKPISKLLTNTLFLHMLSAESSLLVNIEISLPADSLVSLEDELCKAFFSDRYSDVAHAWNDQRRLVVTEAITKHLVPTGVKWIREWLKEEEEEFLADACTELLERRLDCAPYRTEDLEEGDIPTVLAVSCGKGEPKDAVIAIYMDDRGRMREHAKFDNLRDSPHKEAFQEFVKRRKPDVIGIAGLSAFTARVFEDVTRAVGKPEEPDKGRDGEQQQSQSNGQWGDGGGGGWGADTGSQWGTGANAGLSGDSGWGDKSKTNGDANHESGERYPDIIYVPDEVARIYQHSTRAAEEFSALSVTGRYCVGLARYVQDPLNEYAALGEDISVIKLDDDQRLLPKNRLLTAMERALVTIVNKVGVDIHRAVTDSYYQHLLRFVCGLGPRKAQSLVKRIATSGGSIVNRGRLIKDKIFTWTIFVNAAAFLRIPQDPDTKDRKRKTTAEDAAEQPDPLDGTRVHPEDYDLARKMATDALELDEEDVAGEHPSAVVDQLMSDDDCERKLDDLSLDDFAISLLERMGDKKRFTLDMIKEELVNPSREKRGKFVLLDGWGRMTMMTGETKRTLYTGRPVAVQIYRVKQHYSNCRLDSGVEGVINHNNVSDDQNIRGDEVLARGQTVNGMVIDVVPDKLLVEIALQQTALKDAHPLYPPRSLEDFDLAQHERDQEALQRKKRQEQNAARRMIKHPEFRNFGAQQAEQYLSKKPKGDVVIRPSSKGPDHLVVTWKVEDGLYQHIDVYDPEGNIDATGVGHELKIGDYKYSDLDELLVNHIGQLVKRVNDLMEHEKFHKGSDEARRQYLNEFVLANPGKSIYAFGLDRQHPGYFVVDFMINKATPLQSWPIKVTPKGYRLLDSPTEVASVAELCNAFKLRYIHQMGQAGPSRPGGGRTPFGAGSSTPRPSGRTPYRPNPVAHTPNPYTGGAATPNPYGQQTPRPGPPVSAYGALPPQSPYPSAGGWGAPQPTAAAGGWGAPPPAGAAGGWGAPQPTGAAAGGWDNSSGW